MCFENVPSLAISFPLSSSSLDCKTLFLFFTFFLLTLCELSTLLSLSVRLGRLVLFSGLIVFVFFGLSSFGLVFGFLFFTLRGFTS